VLVRSISTLSISPKSKIAERSQHKITRCRSAEEARGHVTLYREIYDRGHPMEPGIVYLPEYSLAGDFHTTSYWAQQPINMYRTTAGKAAEADELKTKPVRLAVRGRGMAYSSPLP